MIVYGTDKKGGVLATLKIDGLQAGTKYKVDIAVTTPGLTQAKATNVKIATAKWKVPKPSAKTLVVGTDDVKFDVKVPATAKRTPGATYDNFAVYVQEPANKKGRILLGIAHVDNDSTDILKKLTLSAAYFADLPTNATKGYKLFVNAISLGDGVNSEAVVNKSAEGKLTVKKGASASNLMGLINKTSVIPQFNKVSSDATSVELEWNLVAAATGGYQIRYRALMENGSWSAWSTTLIDVAAGTTSATVSGLDVHTQYEFQVCSVIGAMPDTWSQYAFMTSRDEKVVVSTPLDTPTNVAMANHTATTLMINWTGDERVGSCTIQWSLTNDFADVMDMGQSTTASYEITGLTASTPYYIRIKATTTAEGFENSSWSDIESFTTAKVDDVPLDMPIGVIMDSRTDTSLTISWTDVSDAESYTIQWSLTADFADVIDMKNCTDTSCEITGLTASTPYYMRIKATTTAEGFADSKWSGVESFTTASEAEDVPIATPQNVSMEDHTATTLLVKWNVVLEAQKYAIRWAASVSAFEDYDGGDTTALIDSEESNSATYMITGLTAEQTIFVRVIALTTAPGFKNSAPSDAVDMTTIPQATPLLASPYEDVDWSNKQYKTSLHLHTSNSDAKQISPAQLLEELYRRGYDIVAITDHIQNKPTDPDQGVFPNALTPNWTSITNGLTPTRNDEIAARDDGIP